MLPVPQVVVLDKLDYCGSLKNLAAAAAAPGFKFIKGDLQSGDLLSYILSTERIDTVMHFAAQVLSCASFLGLPRVRRYQGLLACEKLRVTLACAYW